MKKYDVWNLFGEIVNYLGSLECIESNLLNSYVYKNDF